MESCHPIRFDAACLRECIERRKLGLAPMPWDNAILRRAREPQNPLPVCKSIDAPEGWREARVLAMLRTGSATLSEIADAIGGDGQAALELIDSLRGRAWWIQSAGGNRFMLVPGRSAA